MQNVPSFEIEAECQTPSFDFSFLDDQGAPLFNDLTILAARICDTPIAMTFVVDTDRIRLLSTVGLDSDFADRAETFCARILREMQLAVLTGAITDANDFQCDMNHSIPSSRSFAGIPLKTDDGDALGMLCVIDSIVRNWTPAELDSLKTIANQVVSQLLLRHRNWQLTQIVAASSAAKEEAEARCLATSDFVAKVSHEVRTPICGIIGMIEMATDTLLSTPQREIMGTIKTSADSLLQIVNRILDLSKIEAGGFELEPRPFGLRETLSDLVKSIAILAQKKNLDLTCDIADDVPGTVIGDAGRLGQVLINLIGNAIKFTERGSIGLSVQMAFRMDEIVRLHFSVSDTGIGIDEDQLNRIFEPFARAQSSAARAIEGTGLGLSISRQIVRQMGGEISVESRPGSGSRFHFAIELGLNDESQSDSADCDSDSNRPLYRIDDVDSAAWQVAPWPLRRRLRVLLAEDNPVNQRITARMLEKLGHSVCLVDNGQLALDVLETEDFDLILLDIEMPVMDGYCTANAIRQRESNHADRRPVIGISAHTSLDKRRLNGQSGIDDFIGKPLDSSELSAALVRVLSSARHHQRVTMSHEMDRNGESEIDTPFDLMAAKKKLDGDGAFVREMAELYLEGIPELLASLQDAMDVREISEAGEIVHSIGGSLISLCARPAFHAARRLEFTCQNNNWEMVEANYHDFVREIERLNAAVRSELEVCCF